jgi:hypothetical protein
MSDASASNRLNWRAVDLSGDPHIILGRREKGGIEAVRLDIHEDLHATVRQVCSAAIQHINHTESREYEPHAALEAGEQHFILTTERLKNLALGLDGASNGSQQSGKSARDSGEVQELKHLDATAEDPALITCLANPPVHRLAEREEFLTFDPFFYAIAWQQSSGSWVSFIRKTNPQQFFKVGRIWCQYTNTLKQVQTQPTFALDSQIDVVLAGNNLAGFSVSALNFLFTDVRLVQTGVPTQVAEISQAISETIPLSNQSIESLIALGKKFKSVANRLYGLSARLRELQEHDSLTTERYREIAKNDDQALSLLGLDGQLDFDEAGAHIFLDVIEGRYFEDDWTGSPRRADRYSRRKQKHD